MAVRLFNRYLLISAVTICVLICLAFVLTAFSGRMVKAFIQEKAGKDLMIQKVSIGWGGKIEGQGVRILKNGREVARARLVVLYPSLTTLFRQVPTLTRIVVEEPVLALTINKNNRLIAPFPETTEGEKQSETRPFHVGRLQIRDAMVTIEDQRPGEPAQSQIHDLNLSIGSFSNPLSDTPSSVSVFGRVSGRILSGQVSASGRINFKTGAMKLVCTAEGVSALQHPSQAPQIRVDKLSFRAESAAGSPVTIADINIENPYYRYAAKQKHEIAQALPVLSANREEKHTTSVRPVVLLKGISVKGGEIVVMEPAEPGNAPPIRVVNAALTIDRLALPVDNTSSSFDFSGHIPGKQTTANLHWSGTTSFGNLETDSRLSLQSLDLTSFRPYLVQKGEMPVAGGTVDIAAHVRIHNRYLDAPVTATIRNLRLLPSKSLKDRVLGVPRSLLLDSLKTGKDQIRINFLVSGSLDNPHFSLRENITKRFVVSLAKSLGLSSVVDAGETVISRGARAVQGAGQGIKGLGQDIKRLFGK